ncbi:MAG TPA: hypothetical protein VFN30_12230 [Chitinophagaceae bacterium]|nr:hypothetical protein [Chitinophagaceae bacterium]
MKETKSTLLLLVPIVLLLLSLLLLFKWGLQLNQLQKAVQPLTLPKKDSITFVSALKDSLQKIYNITLSQLDNQLTNALVSTDSLATGIDTKLSDFYKLKNEISAILKKPASAVNLQLIEQKINSLQAMVNVLKSKNKDMEEENQRLNTMLATLREDTKPFQQNSNPSISIAQSVSSTAPLLGNFTLSNMHLSALMTDEEKEMETSLADLTDKFAGSFTLKNNSSYKQVEIAVVLIGPDGQVIKNSEWETGTFETKEGRKIYSYKTGFEYLKGEIKKVSFSLNIENPTRGNYTMQVYQNGTLIGRVQKILS